MDVIGFDLIEDAIGIEVQLADILVVDLRYHLANARQLRELQSFIDNRLSYFLSVVPGIGSNEIMDVA